MSKSKITNPEENPPNTIEFLDGELFVFGKQIRAHSEMPWLFCATDLHKACEFFIKRAAVRKGEDPEVKFTSKRPVSWVSRHLADEDSVADIADITRKRIKERGAYLGLKPISKKSNATAVALLDTLSDKEMILYSRKGNSPTSGTYLSLHALVQYASFMNKSLHTKIIQCYMDVITGDVDRVLNEVVTRQKRAKGSKELEQCKEAGVELARVCAEKGIRNTLKVQEGINHGVLGMPGEKYRKLNGLDKPLNDNLTVSQVQQKMHANVFAVEIISSDRRAQIPAKEAKPIGLRAGAMASVLCEDQDIIALMRERADARVKVLSAQLKSRTSAR